jgi:hypothetical protein
MRVGQALYAVRSSLNIAASPSRGHQRKRSMAGVTVLFGREFLHDLQRFFYMLIWRKLVGSR